MTPPKPLPIHLNSGGFLLGEIRPQDIFTPEDLSFEQRAIEAVAEKFMEKEVLPHTEALEHMEEGLTLKMLRKAGELGLLAMQTNPEFGGLGLDCVSTLGATGHIYRLMGFGVSWGAHAGIGTKPLLYFGTEAQKEKYLPRLSSGEWIGAFALTETASGSDALSMKTRATLSPDGKKYLLSGDKMWISNAGWADLFTVFAKVDGKHVSAFLVEKTFPGISTGREEQKMGIKSSSTRRLILDDVAVPSDNLLGEIGKGAYIAFNILNTGRLALGANSIGVCKDMLKISIRYAQERHQFGRPLTSFGLIQHKLAEMAVRIFACESATYRAAGMVDAIMETGEKVDSMTPAIPRGIEEPASECSILKVACTEIMDYVVDEALQIHGGYGFSEEFPTARAYRDSRINRIFEGTNEINRIFIPTFLLQRAQRGRLPLQEAIKKVNRELLDTPSKPGNPVGRGCSGMELLMANWKKSILLLLGQSHEKYGDKLSGEQELLGGLSDMIIDTYLAESALLRTLKCGEKATQADLLQVFIQEASSRMYVSARTLLVMLSDGKNLADQLDFFARLLQWQPVNTVIIRRRLCQKLCDRGSYPALLS